MYRQQQRHLLLLFRRSRTPRRESSGLVDAAATFRVACRPCSSYFCGKGGGGEGGDSNALSLQLGGTKYTILQTRRWINVEINRYMNEQGGHITAVCEAAKEVLACLNTLEDDHLPMWVESFFASLHADALVAFLEYYVSCHPCSLFRSSQGEGIQSNEISALCGALLVAIAKRGVELSSKHVAFISSLYSASGLDVRLFLFTLYHCRHSLRRTQAVQTLRSMCFLRFSTMGNIFKGYGHQLTGGSVESYSSLYTSALSFLIFRCMELEQTHEGYDIQSLLCHVLTLHYSGVQHDIRTACLWWVRRGAHKNNDVFHSPTLGVKLDDTAMPSDVFLAADAASRSLGLSDLDRAYVHLLHKKDYDANSVWRTTTVRSVMNNNNNSSSGGGATYEWKDPALVLHQQLPIMERLSGMCKLQAVETLSQRVLELTQLHTVVELAESVQRYCPSLSQVVIHRMLQLSCLDEETTTTSSLSITTAMHRLLPHANILDVLEGVVMMMHGIFTPPKKANASLYCKDKTMSLRTTFVKCLAMHLPGSLIPVMCHRLCRQRELAVFRLPPFLLRVLMQALEYMTLPESFSSEDAACIHSFIRQEKRKVVIPHYGRHVKKEETVEKESNSLLAAIETCVDLRSQNSSGSVPLQLPTKFTSPSAAAVDISKPMIVSKTALMSLFGVRASLLVTPETVVQERASLAWLYAVYRMSVSIICELEALARLAFCQGVSLRINERQRRLVELSESAEEDLTITCMNGNLSMIGDNKMDKHELCACIEEWLLNNEKSVSAFKRLVAVDLLKSDKIKLSSFLCYAAISRQDVFAMKELRQHSVFSDSIFSREGSLQDGNVYRMPLQLSKNRDVIHGSTSTLSSKRDKNENMDRHCDSYSCDNDKRRNSSGTVTDENWGDCKGGAAVECEKLYKGCHAPDLMAGSKNALVFVNKHWGEMAPAPADVVRLWAYMDLFLVGGGEEEGEGRNIANKLECYEAILRLCKTDGLAVLAEHIPACIHREAFALMGGRGLWGKGLSLLQFVETASRNVQIPQEAYQQVMRACLMHRAPVPEFLRKRVQKTVST